MDWCWTLVGNLIVWALWELQRLHNALDTLGTLDKQVGGCVN